MTVQEFNRAVDAYSDNLFRFAFKHLRNEMNAKDIVQETFAKVWQKHEEVSAGKVKSYLFSTAYHAIVDWAKKDQRTSSEEINDYDVGAAYQDNFDVQTILHEALDRLPEIQKSVVLLRDYEGYSYDEIAEICALSEAQVKVYIFRARKALKSYLKNTELIV